MSAVSSALSNFQDWRERQQERQDREQVATDDTAEDGASPHPLQVPLGADSVETVTSDDEDSQEDEESAESSSGSDSPAQGTTGTATATAGAATTPRNPEEMWTHRPLATRRRNYTLTDLEEERERSRRRTSFCVLISIFLIFRLWIEAVATGDFLLLMVCLMASSWTARFIRHTREREEELNRMIAEYNNNPEGEQQGDEVAQRELQRLSFQAQLAMAILNSQRDAMQGGFGHPDGGPNTPGVSEEAKEKWDRFDYAPGTVEAASDTKNEEEPQCSICLGEYEEGEELWGKGTKMGTKEPTPLWITPLVQCPNITPDVGRYQVLQRLVTESPYSSNAEIETSLELYFGPEGQAMWKRVVVRSGPTTPTPVVHASFQLSDVELDDYTPSNGICWASFPDHPDHKLLCVLASPTLLCVWDVYPEGDHSTLAGEGHKIPLPFEAQSIHAIPASGLLIQRAESLEDLQSDKNWQYSNNAPELLQGVEDDEPFVLKPPPRPVRTSIDTLHVSTAPTTAQEIPSLFTLSHPLQDVLPVASEGPQGMTTDVFEKILFVGEISWVNPKDAYMDRKEHVRQVCVTYHVHQKRHAIWEIQPATKPPPPAPLWKVSNQWRSHNGWSSHLGVFHQDLEDMELLPDTSNNTRVRLTAPDGSTRTDALADALGIRKSPRKTVDDVGGKARSAARQTTKGRRSSKEAANNISLLTPLSRQAVNESTSMMEVDASIESSLKPPLLSMGPFSSLHPEYALSCVFQEEMGGPAARHIFVASNLNGSGRLSVCLVIPETESSSDHHELRNYTLTPKDASEIPTGTVALSSYFTVLPQTKIPCLSAVPLESSPVPSCFHPHRRYRSEKWKKSAVDILILQGAGPTTQLSLYRVQNSVGQMFDLVFRSESNDTTNVRAEFTLKLETSTLGERMLDALESADHTSSWTRLALDLRCDSVRLAESLKTTALEDMGPDAVGTIIQCIAEFEVSGRNVNDLGATQSLPAKENVAPWEKLLQSNFHKSFDLECRDALFPISQVANVDEGEGYSAIKAELSKLLARTLLRCQEGGHLYTKELFLALHFLYEDYKLHSNSRDDSLRRLGTVLVKLTKTIQRDDNNLYLGHYVRDLGETWYRNLGSFGTLPKVTNSMVLEYPFCILSLVDAFLTGGAAGISVSAINEACHRSIAIYRVFEELCSERSEDFTSKRDMRVVEMLLGEGFTDPAFLRDNLPTGVCIPLLEVLHRCRNNHNSHAMVEHSSKLWTLIGREDLRKNSEVAKDDKMEWSLLTESMSTKTLDSSVDLANFEDTEMDGVRPLELSSSMLFPNDNRIREVGRLLRSSVPVYLNVPRAIEVSDHDYERLKQEKLLLLSSRILALPVGRGMFTIGNLQPVPAEPLPLPEICLSGRVPPSNATLALDTTECPQDMKVWPDFHNGVAAGLRLPLSQNAGELVSKITRTWIVYNRPSNQQAQNPSQQGQQPSSPPNMGHAHGGLLMALGLRGHLTTLEMTDIFDYLTQGTVTTTVGVLLGMAGNMRGTCDISVSKMLCLHIPSLIPQHFSAIEVASSVQAAAVAGAGLLYQGSSHRMMTEFLLNEIGKRPTNDANVVDRDAYTLSCGIALGMVNLCKGESYYNGEGNAGLADLKIEERLYKYIVGGFEDSEMKMRRDDGERLNVPSATGPTGTERCSCVHEGDSININVTSPAATLALGLIYMKSGNNTIAGAISLPDTHFLLEYVRPDFLMLRVIARGLILWDGVEPSRAWIDQQVPTAVNEAYHEMIQLADELSQGITSGGSASQKEFDKQAVRLMYVHVVAGACFALGLRFAGTGNRDAVTAIMERVMEFKDLRDAAGPVTSAMRPSAPILEMCLGCAAVSLSMVLAGTGDMEAFRLLRALRWRCNEETNYGSHMAYSSAIGLLFLGGGTCTLGRDPEDIAALVAAFYPRYPSTTSCNQYHLQALRNLYALAVKRRDLRAIDVDTGESVFVPVEVHYKDSSMQPMKLTAPCLVSNTSMVTSELRVTSERYYPVVLTLNSDFRGKIFYVKRRSAHLSYKNDPGANRSLLVQTGGFQGGNPMELIRSFTGDSVVLEFAKHFCGMKDNTTNAMSGNFFSIRGFCQRVLFECLMMDTSEVLPIYLALRSAIGNLQARTQTAVFIAWDFRLTRSYYAHRSNLVRDNSHRLMNMGLLAYLNELLEVNLDKTSLGSTEKQQIKSALLSVLHKHPIQAPSHLMVSSATMSSTDAMEIG
eukprot:Nitzschia sp. Nitz4//scaffold57_size113557//99271//106700//NITZ4_004008-RA/size113557-processed-gene-0.20-mRNA-1//1//CDS//3329554897//741//frame0